MRVMVLGAGLRGVTTAYYLQQLGHEVIVVDRHALPAARVRGGHGAQAPAEAAEALAAAHHRRGRLWPLYRRVRRTIGALPHWMERTIGTDAPDPKDHLARLGAYSRQTVRSLHEESSLRPAIRHRQVMNIYTDADAFRAAVARAARLNDIDHGRRMVDADEAVRLEPALAPARAMLAGASVGFDYNPDNAADFATGLVFLCKAASVRFVMNHTITGLEKRHGRIHRVESRDAQGRTHWLQANAYVMALGADGARFARGLRLELPTRFVREYDLEMPLLAGERAPQLVLHDPLHRLRVVHRHGPDEREGGTLRVSCSVPSDAIEPPALEPARFDELFARLDMLLPGVGDGARAQRQSTLKLGSATELPLIGRTRLPNLFVNMALGSSGWISACGAGKSIARIISGLTPEVDFAFSNP